MECSGDRFICIHPGSLRWRRWFVRLVVVVSAIGTANVMLMTEILVRYEYDLDEPERPTSENRTYHISSQKIDRRPRNHHGGIITAAVCHPTLHGEPDLERVLHFVAYYKKLGFDHIFLWYMPHIQKRPFFDQLRALSHVTLTKFDPRDSVYFGQGLVEHDCLSGLARSYTWVLVADADEYLWFSEKMNVKEFLGIFTNFTYLSFGKWMYTVRYKTAQGEEALFGGLNYYAFTGKSYCFSRPGSDVCPTWEGRCKVMARPNLYQYVNVHGDPSGKNGSTHFHTAIAHLKEWPSLLSYPMQNSTVRAKEPFLVSGANASDLRMHWLPVAYANNSDGTVTIHYDEELQEWFQFVSSLEN
jgi:Glycosyltransferase family 92